MYYYTTYGEYLPVLNDGTNLCNEKPLNLVSDDIIENFVTVPPRAHKPIPLSLLQPAMNMIPFKPLPGQKPAQTPPPLQLPQNIANKPTNLFQKYNAAQAPPLKSVNIINNSSSMIPIVSQAYLFNNSNNFSTDFKSSCVILPKLILKKIKNTNNYIIKNNYNGYELDLHMDNSSDTNNIILDNLSNNFITIINTNTINNKMTQPCTIIIKGNNQLYQIDDTSKLLINNNDYLCNNPTSSMPNNSLKSSNSSNQLINTGLFTNAIKKDSILVNSNQQIMIITDRPSCNKTKQNYNVYVYINNKNSSNMFNNCIKYHMISNVFTANTIQITSQYNGQIIHLPNLKNITLGYGTLFIGNDETNTENYITNPFLTIINTSNKAFNSLSYPSSSLQMNSSTGTINFNSKSLPANVKYNFYVSSINLNNSTNRINKKTRLGPFNQINFIGNPVIIIYVPPYIKQNSNNIDSQDSSSIYDIYINTFYN